MGILLESEPNNSLATADPISIGDTARGSVSYLTDLDYYKLVVAGPTVITLQLAAGNYPAYTFTYAVEAAGSRALGVGFLGPSTNPAGFSLALPAADAYYLYVCRSSAQSADPYELVLTAGPGSPGEYERESNGTRETATPAQVGSPMNGQLGLFGDQDYFALDLAGPGLLALGVRAPRVSSSSSVRASLLDEGGATLREVSTGSGASMIVPVSAGGRYYLRVSDAETADDGNYAFLARAYDASVLDDHALALGVPADGAIGAAGEIGFYAVTLQAGSVYRFALSGAASGGGTLATTSLALLGPDGRTLEPTSSSHTPGGEASMDLLAPADGTYYLAVGGGLATGSYRLTAAERTPGPVAETEPNDTKADATLLVPGDTATGRLATQGDWDWYEVAVPGPTVVDFRLDAVEHSNWIYWTGIDDPSGVLLANAVVGFDLNRPSFTVAFPQAGSYYVYVSPGNEHVPDAYSLSLVPVAASVADFEREENDATTQANPLRLGQLMGGQLRFSDVDTFALALPAADLIAVGFASGAEGSDSRFAVALLDAAGAVIAQREGGDGFTLVAPGLAAGDYYVRVSGGAGYDPGGYRFVARAFDDPASGATPLDPQAPATGTIDEPGAMRFFSVALQAGELCSIDLRAAASGAGTLRGATLALLGPDGDWLDPMASRESAGGEASIDFVADVAGTYRVAVAGDAGTGSFTLAGRVRSPGPVSEAEFNDARGSANVLLVGDTATGALATPADVDVYSVTVAAPTVLDLRLTAGRYEDLAFEVSVEDEAGALLARDHVGWGWDETVFAAPLRAPGTYFVTVSNRGDYSDDVYMLAVRPSAVPLADFEAEPNGAIANADPVALGQPVTGSLGTADDVDTWAFDLPAAAGLVLGFDPNHDIRYRSFEVALLDADGDVVARQRSGAGFALFEETLPAGRYHVQVSTGDWHYEVDYRFVVQDYPGIRLDDAALTTAAPLPGEIAEAGGVRFHPVSLVAGQCYAFELGGALSSGGSLEAPVLTLFAPQGAQLAQSAYGALYDEVSTFGMRSGDPALAFVAPVTGTYAVAVGNAGGPGTYTLEMSQHTHAELGLSVSFGGGYVAPDYHRWPVADLSQATTITYAFPDAPFAAAAPDEFGASFTPLSLVQRQDVRDALGIVSSLCNVAFVETGDVAAAQLRYGIEELVDAGGQARWRWDDRGVLEHANVLINAATALRTGPGNYFPEVLLHETGHALGLKHPGVYSPGDADDPPWLPEAWDNRAYTVMSYLNRLSTFKYGSSLSAIDIAALQALYGPPAPSSADPFVFRLSPTAETHTAAPIGRPGDAIDAGNQTVDCIVSLTAGSLSSIGARSDGTPAHQNLAIPVGSRYTHAVGGSGDDLIFGNELANVLSGGPGDDVLFGGPGADTLAGGEGADTYVFSSVLDGADVVADFGAGGVADRIVIDGLVREVTGAGPADYVQLRQQGTDALLLVDLDAGGSVFAPAPFATLSNVQVATVSLSQVELRGTWRTAYDTAPVADLLQVAVVEDTSLQGVLPAARDAQGDAFAYGLATPAAHGVVTIEPDGRFRYTPAPDFNATDSFAFSVADRPEHARTYVATVHVRNVDDPATGTVAIAGAARLGQTLGATHTLDDPDGFDPSEHPVAYQWQWSADGAAWAPIDGATEPTLALGAERLGQQVRVVASFEDAYWHAESVASAPTAAVGGPNRAPVAADATVPATEDETAAGALPAASDADGDAVAYSLVAPAAHGSVVLDSDGAFTYRGAQDFHGVDGFVYRVDDGFGGTNAYSVRVEVASVVDTLVGTAGADLLQETSGDGVVTAGAGDDTIDGGHGDDTIAGGDGVDLARYGGARAGYDLAWSDGVRRVTDRGGVEGSDRLDGVERLQFADRKVAVDVLLANELQGNAAGITAKVLGAVFGRDAVAIAEYAGIGLQLLDAGVSYEQLMQLALQVRLGADFTLDAEVSLFYRTLAGAEATPADLAFWSGFVGAAGLTPAQLGVLAADTALNAANVGLAGLQQAGLEYL